MLRCGNVKLSCARSSRASTVLISTTSATPIAAVSRTQHPSYFVRHYTPLRTWKGRDSSGPRGISPGTTQWDTKDRYVALEKRNRWQRKSQREAIETAKDKNLKDQEEGEGNEDEEHVRKKREPKKRMSQAEFEREMQYIKYDRVALARRVSQLLKLGHEEKATLLVWASQNAKIDCIVSWNTLIEHKMKTGRQKEAVRLFNDVSLLSAIKPHNVTDGMFLLHV